jgi:hypothetical protein
MAWKERVIWLVMGGQSELAEVMTIEVMKRRQAFK